MTKDLEGKTLYRDDVSNALQELHEKSLWMRRDMDAPIHTEKDADRKELCDLCLTVFKVFCVGTDYFLDKKLVNKKLEDVLDKKACERSMKI